MTSQTINTTALTETSPRKAARIAGVGYLIIFVLAIFANFVVREGLIDADNAAATFANIADSEFLFRAGIIAFLAVFIVDVVIAWALYVLFKSVSKELSLLTGWFRLVYTVFLGVALIFLLVVLDLVSGVGYLTAFEPGQLHAQVMLMLNAFNYAWLIGLAGFGIHLMLLGYLMLASGTAPRVLSILLAIAGAAYVFDTVANALLANYAEYETVFLLIVAVPSVVAELWFAVWLLTRGGVEQGALQ
ncbi:MAG: DUF4386 domain-containing protein [Actinomycetota bacterium]|nr:DUF4386 domain-containing protein [Actinomycetota bacterium]